MDPATQSLIEQTATAAAEKACHHLLTTMGIDTADPIEMQRDMAALGELRHQFADPEFQADMLHIRKWRTAMDAVQRKGMITLVGLLITGCAALVWLGLKNMLGGN